MGASKEVAGALEGAQVGVGAGAGAGVGVGVGVGAGVGEHVMIIIKKHIFFKSVQFKHSSSKFIQIQVMNLILQIRTFKVDKDRFYKTLFRVGAHD